MFTILFTIIVISNNGNVAVSTQLSGQFDNVESCAYLQKRLVEAAPVGLGAARYQSAQCVRIVDVPKGYREN